MISVQRGELLAVVPGEGITSVAMVTSHPEPVEVSLRFQPEADVFSKRFAPSPVLQGHQKLVSALIGQPVNVLQP